MDELVLFLFGMIGVVAFLNALYSTIMSYVAKSWDLVTGYVDEEDFFTTEDDGETWYNARVHYNYKFKKRAYKGKRLAFGLYSSTIENLVLKPYLESTRISPVTVVYVNPKNPKMSVLVVGIKAFHWFSLVFFTLWNMAFYCYILLP